MDHIFDPAEHKQPPAIPSNPFKSYTYYLASYFKHRQSWHQNMAEDTNPSWKKYLAAG